ncbi:MAG TPA: hypothetical protein VHN37_08645 [Actinomycetota bacterium]|nr:hypothetical protein [Actinomycetota bacterium]
MRVALIALFTAMVIVALWGWLRARSTGRFAVRVGSPGAFDGTLSKGAGLFVWVALGAIVLVGSLLAERDDEWIAAAGAPLLAFLLVMEIVSVRRLTR